MTLPDCRLPIAYCRFPIAIPDSRLPIAAPSYKDVSNSFSPFIFTLGQSAFN